MYTVLEMISLTILEVRLLTLAYHPGLLPRTPL
jgi:hypothetical protein